MAFAASAMRVTRSFVAPSPSATVEALESRRLLSCATSVPVSAREVASLATPAVAVATQVDVSGTYTGTAKLRPVVRHSHNAKYPLSLALAAAVDGLTATGTAALTGFADVAFAGTLTKRRFLASVDGTAGQVIRGTVNSRSTSVTGKVVGVVIGGTTYNGTFTAKNSSPSSTGGGGTGSTGTLPHPDHVVIVVEENHSYGQILGDTTSTPGLPGIPGVDLLNQDDYIRSLAQGGASFTNASAETHPSQPNYLALFSGSTQGVTSDAMPGHAFAGPDLGGELIAKGLTFAGYSEDLPSVGFTGDTSGDYARKHNPWSDFADVPASANLPFGPFPHSAEGYANLPTVSFVVPNQQNDMHSNSVHQADQWLKDNLGGYAGWAQSHNSLLIVTWDEGSGDNHIATIFSGQSVKPGSYSKSISHYHVLRTLQDIYGLAPTGHAADVAPITDVWR